MGHPYDAGTVHEALQAAARRWPDAPFLRVLPETARHYGIEAGVWHFAEVWRAAEHLRERYVRAGLRPGHRVGLLLENRPEFLLHWFALNGLGVSIVPLSAEARASELEYLIAHSEVALVIAVPAAHARLREAAARSGRAVLVATAEEPLPVLPAPAHAEAVVHTGARECALLYTSGTTGRPKGCVLSNRYFLKAGQWYATIGGLAALREGQERMLTPLPLTHMNALAYSTMAMLLTGGCLILLDRFHPHTWWDSVREAEATVIHYLGVMPAILMKAPPNPIDRHHRVRFGFGAGVERTLHAAFEQRFGFPLLEAWAMTETGAGAVIVANEEPRHVGTNCFGRERPEVEVRIVGEDGRDVDEGRPGELWVRAAGVDSKDGFFSGYLKDEAATADAWKEGWFHTGDIVRRGADGQLHFVDRRKNLIRRSGENISAVEVEAVLSRHAAIKAVAVAPTPDDVRGEEVLAVVVPQQPLSEYERRELAHALVELSLRELAYYKAPGYVAFVETLPLTVSNKVARGELKALAATLPGQSSCIDTRALKRRNA